MGRRRDEPRIVQQTKRNVTSDGVVQMRCDARKSRRSGMDREREMGAGGDRGKRTGERERERKYRVLGLGVIFLRQIDKTLITSLSRHRRDLPINPQTGQLGPHLFSIPLLLFARHTCHRSRSTTPSLAHSALSLDPLPSPLLLLLPPLSRLDLLRLLFGAAMSH